MFEDSWGDWNDLYCVQGGKSHPDIYYIYDLYDISQAFLDEYFVTEENYKHFMWVMEQMYTLNTANSEDMENNLLNNLCLINPNARSYYEGMLSELNTVFKENCNEIDYNSWDYTTNAWSYMTRTDGNNVELPWYIINAWVPTRVKYAETPLRTSVDERTLFIRMLQSNVLMSYFMQENGKFGAPVLDKQGDSYHIYDIWDIIVVQISCIKMYFQWRKLLTQEDLLSY